jgi:deoxyribodipyrimidine photolyase-related protein
VRYSDFEKSPCQSFGDALGQLLEKTGPLPVIVTEPGEWRVRDEIERWHDTFGVPVEVRPDNRFFAPLSEFHDFAKDRKEWRMEHFYRKLRRKTGLLMRTDGKPEGGKWNFDHDNRKSLPDDIALPDTPHFPHDDITNHLIEAVPAHHAGSCGSIEGFGYAVTRKDALAALDHFIGHRLPLFGDYQDAMTTRHRLLFHAVISPYLNVGLLSPIEVCRAAEAAWHSGSAPLNAVEGFIRQILGWREYVRGLYWEMGRDYHKGNYLGAKRALPWFFWTGDVAMNCLHHAISDTLETAYAHHIQRLMVIGNFALLAGLNPKEVCDWYLAVYADAFEWVELPNTLGMALYADGGKMGSKPYAASGKYINRMSDYCTNCRYDPAKSTGADACPYNALYWHFIDRHADKLSGNPRMAMPYRTWARMKDEKRHDLIAQADSFLSRLDNNALPARQKSPSQGQLL